MPKRKQSKRKQSKRNKKIKSEETCVTETLDYEEPLLDANGEVVYNTNGSMKFKPIESFDVRSCYLDGIDLNDMDGLKSIPIIQYL